MAVPALAWVIAVCCSVAFILFDATRKRLTADWPILPLLAILMLGQAVIIGLSWGWLWQSGQTTWPTITNDYLMLAGVVVVLNVAANGLFLLAIRLAPFSLVMPMLSLSPLFAAVGEFLFLGQTLPPQHMVGIAGIMLATFGLAWHARNQPTSNNADHTRTNPLRGVAAMAAVALLWALVPVVDKASLALLPPGLASNLWHGWVTLIPMGVVPLVLVWATPKASPLPAPGKAPVRWLLVALAAATASTVLQLWAVTLMPVGLFEGQKRALTVLGALMVGKCCFNEKITPTQLVWVGAIGVSLLLLA